VSWTSRREWLDPPGEPSGRTKQIDGHAGNFFAARALSLRPEGEAMIVERGLKVMNIEVVGDAYSIAANYLRKRGEMPDAAATDSRLLQIIVEMFHRGDNNKISLANRAITKFEAAQLAA
jgi:hypothetical protein